MKDMNLLGLKVVDSVTGFIGIVTSVSYDLYGCIQAVVVPLVDEKGEIAEGRWFDTKRLQIIDSTPVMDVPKFDIEIPGGQSLPLQKRY